MNGNKSVTASFVVSTNEDVAPWLETFTLADGVKSHGCAHFMDGNARAPADFERRGPTE